MYSLPKREVFDRHSLMQEWGITPEQAVDFQTLVGDSVDNVKGVPGIGPKTASALLQKYQTLDNLLAHIDEIPGKKQENLRASVEILKTTRQLVRLNVKVPVKYDWDRWRLQSWDNDALRDLFNAWGMRGFARQVPATAGRVTERQPTSRQDPSRILTAAFFKVHCSASKSSIPDEPGA